jgi:anti-sigma factor RsiW
MIMDCERCADDLTAFLDGELSPGKSKEMQAHLNSCRHCAEELSSLSDSANFINSRTKEIPLKPEIWNNIRARLSTMDVSTRSAGFSLFWQWHRWWVAATAVATAMGLALGFWGYLRYAESQASLRVYMEEYVAARKAQEQMPRIPATLVSGNPSEAGMISSENSDNPFSEPVAISYNNPFHSEDE